MLHLYRTIRLFRCGRFSDEKDRGIIFYHIFHIASDTVVQFIALLCDLFCGMRRNNNKPHLGVSVTVLQSLKHFGNSPIIRLRHIISGHIIYPVMLRLQIIRKQDKAAFHIVLQ